MSSTKPNKHRRMPGRTAHRGPFLAATLTVAVVLSGCITAPVNDTTPPDPPPPPATPNPMTLDTLGEGSYPQGPSAAEDRVIADDDTWHAFWQQHQERKGDTDPAAAPATDFDRAFILFAYAGEKPSGSHAIHIDDVYRVQGNHTANVRDIKPSYDCITTQALTYPYHLVRVTRSSGDDGGVPEVRFDHRTRTLDC